MNEDKLRVILIGDFNINLLKLNNHDPTQGFLNTMTSSHFAGDLNLHIEDPLLPEAFDFRDILDQFGMAQHIAESTHLSGGWLDVILTRDDCALTDLSVHPPTISDHGLIFASIPFLCELPSYFLRQVRDWRSFDREAFRLALLDSPA